MASTLKMSVPISRSCSSSHTINIGVSPELVDVSNQLLPRTPSVDLFFYNLNVKLNDDKYILRNVSGFVKSGQMLAVMGPSGCGKTTLLNCLSGRTDLNSGCVHLNRDRLDTRRHKHSICYSVQQDIFFPNLTVAETVTYAAMLKLPETWSSDDKHEFVNRILKALDLIDCQHTIIGDCMTRGLSGGETKRVGIACELLTNPPIVLLDEPTSGLDSNSASKLILLLKKYAKTEGKTIVVTLHQPSAEIFYSFDNLLLMCDGRAVYFGDIEKVLDFFQNDVNNVAAVYNPADFILKRIIKNNGEQVTDNERDSSDLLACCHDCDGVRQNTNDAELDVSWPTTFWTQFTVLTRRNFNISKSNALSAMNWTQTIVLGIMNGALWYQSQQLSDIRSYLFFSMAYWMLFAHFGAVIAFPLERDVVNKERKSGTYRLSAYYLAKMVSELPLTVILPTVYHLISYPMLGTLNAETLLFTWIFLLLNTIVAQSVGFFIGAFCMNMQTSITASALYTLAAQLFGGYFVTTIPGYLQCVQYLNMIHYGFQNMQIVQFDDTSTHDIVIVRDPSLLLCMNTIVLLGFLIVFRLLGYLVLRFKK